MDIKTALEAYESKEQSSEVEVRQNIRELAHREPERDCLKTTVDDLATLLGRLSETPIQEIEKLIDGLQALRKNLQNKNNRIQRDIAEYAALSEQVVQLTAVICDGVKKLPRDTDR
jgi:histidyl-tRNA synthetase